MGVSFVAAGGTVSLVFIDDVTADRRSRRNSEAYRVALPAKLMARRFTVQTINASKHIEKATQELLKAKKWSVLKRPSQSPDLNPVEHAFHFTTNQQQLKAAAVKAWKSISRVRGNSAFGDACGFQVSGSH